MASDSLVAALMGNAPAALAENVTLDTALTIPRIVGRDRVSKALSSYADLFRASGVYGAQETTYTLQGEDLEGAVFTSTVDGHTVQVLSLVTHDEDGMIASIHMYGRPWPYMALFRDQLAKIDPELTTLDWGSAPYVADGPGTSWIDPPPIPPFAEDISFVSPLLTAEAVGPQANERILTAASQVYGEQHFRAILEVEGRSAIAAVFDGVVEGNVLQLVAIFTLNENSELEEIRIFSRPWPVTASFRRKMYQRLDDLLGTEFWQGPHPEAPLPLPLG
jgi:hypothetical protein